jgi:hypothetical protein
MCTAHIGIEISGAWYWWTSDDWNLVQLWQNNDDRMCLSLNPKYPPVTPWTERNCHSGWSKRIHELHENEIRGGDPESAMSRAHISNSFGRPYLRPWREFWNRRRRQHILWLTWISRVQKSASSLDKWHKAFSTTCDDTDWWAISATHNALDCIRPWSTRVEERKVIQPMAFV